MKFSHSLQFNCVPEWTEHYLKYGGLKRSLYALERALYEGRKGPAAASDGQGSPAKQFETLDIEFHALFTSELERVIDFYAHKEEQCRSQFARDNLTEDQVKQLYISLNDLVYFYELNREGFLKVAQKYGKFINAGRGDLLKLKVDSDMALDQINDLKTLIRKIEAEHDETLLRKLLRERVIFERSTVWQDMVEMERKTSGLEVVQESAASSPPTTTVPDIEKSAPVKGATPHSPGHGSMTAGAKAKKILLPVFCVAIFIALWLSPFFEEPHMNRALAVVVFTVSLWCTEALPLYATAMLVPLMVSIGEVFQPGFIHYPLHSQHPADVAKYVYGKMFSETIMLLLGGFSLASALSKYGIAKMLATTILGRVGRNPGVILLVVMVITTLASFVMSNVAAPVLTFSLIQPLLRALGVDHPLAKSLVVGVAYAANIGGLISPISSPQNLFAMKDLGSKALGWGCWLAGSFPVAIVTTLTTWVVLRVAYRTNAPIPDILRVKPGAEPLNGKQIYVCAVTLLTIVLWVSASATKSFLGGLGVLALFPLVVLFGSGMLSKDDFNAFLWNVVMLAMGGSVVGVVVNDSGLLRVVSLAISERVQGYSMWVVTAIFSSLMLFVATFVSHSVSSIIMTPVVVQVANELVKGGMKANAPQVIVIVVTFVCSIGMGMPISGFPNITAMSLEDGAGRTFINSGDFLKTGLIASIIALGVCLSLAYGVFYLVL
jgi:phosphate transporter